MHLRETYCYPTTNTKIRKQGTTHSQSLGTTRTCCRAVTLQRIQQECAQTHTAMRSISPVLLLLSPSSLLLLVLWPSSVESGLRCGFLNNIPFLGATNDRACRASCVVQGQTTGYCDNEGECNCSEEDLNLTKEIRQLLGDMSIAEYVKLKRDQFREEIESWKISEKVKEVAPSRCKLDDDGGFCAGTCHAIGRVTGECNPSRTDCTCSEQTVSPRQWATCLDTGICSIYCVRKGFARGKCAGPTGWDCNCVTNKSDSGEDLVPLELDPEEEELLVEDFNN